MCVCVSWCSQIHHYFLGSLGKKSHICVQYILLRIFVYIFMEHTIIILRKNYASKTFLISHCELKHWKICSLPLRCNCKLSQQFVKFFDWRCIQSEENISVIFDFCLCDNNNPNCVLQTVYWSNKQITVFFLSLAQLGWMVIIVVS